MERKAIPPKIVLKSYFAIVPAFPEKVNEETVNNGPDGRISSWFSLVFWPDFIQN
jgi:hypothetical protein